MARRVASRMRLGLGLTILTIIASLAVNALWGPLYDRYDWRVLAAGGMVVEIIALALLEEFARPQNPYRHLDPRFSYMDAAPTGQLYSGGSGWIWNAAPLALTAALLALTLAAS